MQLKEDVNKHLIGLVTRLGAQCDDPSLVGEKFGDGETPARPAPLTQSPDDAQMTPAAPRLSSVQLIGAGSQSITADIAQTLAYEPPEIWSGSTVLNNSASLQSARQ